MGAYSNMDAAIAGLKHGLDSRVESRAAAAAIPFGKPVFVYAGNSSVCWPFRNDSGILTFSADLSASNSTVVTVNGTAVTAVVYGTSHAATMAALVAQIEAEISGADASYVGDVLTINIDGTEMTVSAVVTGGSAVTVAATYASRQLFLGVALFTQKEYNAASQYAIGDAVNILTRGELYVEAGETVSANSKAYVLNTGSYKGSFGTSGFDTSVWFKQSRTGAGIVLAEVQSSLTDDV